MSAAPDSHLFMARVEALLQEAALRISPLAAGIVVAADMGIADSRSFSRQLGIEHALVLREIAYLSGPDGLVTVTGNGSFFQVPSHPRLPCPCGGRWCCRECCA